jgi:putative FmdB family regulatory protein
MPFYEYECYSCEHFFDERLSISDREIPTETPCIKCGGEVRQLISSTNIGDAVRLGITKPSSEFKEVLTNISDAHPRSELHKKLSQGRRKKGTLD